MQAGWNLREHLDKKLELAKELRSVGKNIADEDILMIILIILPESNENTVSQIESKNDFSLQSIINQLKKNYDAQEELYRAETSQMALKINNKGVKICQLCGKWHHIKRDCSTAKQKKTFPKQRGEMANNVRSNLNHNK